MEVGRKGSNSKYVSKTIEMYIKNGILLHINNTPVKLRTDISYQKAKG